MTDPPDPGLEWGGRSPGLRADLTDWSAIRPAKRPAPTVVYRFTTDCLRSQDTASARHGVARESLEKHRSRGTRPNLSSGPHKSTGFETFFQKVGRTMCAG